MPNDNPFKPGELAEYFIQKHTTKRNPTRPHYDLRLGKPDMGLHSWAVPKARMPDIGEKLLAVRTPIHRYGYGGFSGVLEGGYGAGKVELVSRGPTNIVKTRPGYISFTLKDNQQNKMRYSLIKSKRKEGEWILIGIDPNKPLSPTVKKVNINEKNKPPRGRI